MSIGFCNTCQMHRISATKDEVRSEIMGLTVLICSTCRAKVYPNPEGGLMTEPNVFTPEQFERVIKIIMGTNTRVPQPGQRRALVALKDICTEVIDVAVEQEAAMPELNDIPRQKTRDMIAQATGNAWALEQIAYRLADRVADLERVVADQMVDLCIANDRLVAAGLERVVLGSGKKKEDSP